jgi:hypothetical protein
VLKTTLVAAVPSVGVLFLFWIALRGILQADRRERVAQARIEAEEDAADRERAAAAEAQSSATGNAPGPAGNAHNAGNGSSTAGPQNPAR